ncbi:MAG: hypothetical protein NZL88_07415 [Gaiellaceae bacterium]|nr:hypothetical protein [Gaiellaceae bacterium]
MSRPSPEERLANPDAVLTRSDLAELGYPRRAIDAIFRAATKLSGVEVWEGYSRPLIRVCDFLALREEAAFKEDRVRPGR